MELPPTDFESRFSTVAGHRTFGALTMHKALYFSKMHEFRSLHSNARYSTGCRYKVSPKVSPKTGVKTKRIFVMPFPRCLTTLTFRVQDESSQPVLWSISISSAECDGQRKRSCGATYDLYIWSPSGDRSHVAECAHTSLLLRSVQDPLFR